MQNFKLLSLVGSLVVSMVGQAEECSTISNKDVSQEDQVILIEVKGSYCITEDIKVSEISKFDIHAGSFKRRISTVIATHVPNVSLDLKQHTLISKSPNAKGAQGIAIIKSDIQLKNGHLKSMGLRALGVKHNPSGSPHIKTLTDNNKIRWCRLSYPECEEVSYLNSIDKLPPPNTKTLT